MSGGVKFNLKYYLIPTVQLFTCQLYLERELAGQSVRGCHYVRNIISLACSLTLTSLEECQTKEVPSSPLCTSILFTIPTAKPGPHSTREHHTSRRWVSLSLGKRSTEIAHDKTEPQSTVLVISQATNWYTKVLRLGSKVRYINLCTCVIICGLCLASPCKSLMATFSTVEPLNSYTAMICDLRRKIASHHILNT